MYLVFLICAQMTQLVILFMLGILCKSLDLSSHYNIMGLTLWDICREKIFSSAQMELEAYTAEWKYYLSYYEK